MGETLLPYVKWQNLAWVVLLKSSKYSFQKMQSSIHEYATFTALITIDAVWESYHPIVEIANGGKQNKMQNKKQTMIPAVEQHCDKCLDATISGIIIQCLRMHTNLRSWSHNRNNKSSQGLSERYMLPQTIIYKF